MDIPAFLLVHTVNVEPLLGEGPFGPSFGAEITVRAFVDDKRQLVRAADGNEVVSSTTVYMRLDVECPVGSRVTLPSGRKATALTVSDRDGGALPVPSHIEVALT